MDYDKWYNIVIIISSQPYWFWNRDEPGYHSLNAMTVDVLAPILKSSVDMVLIS